jgi:hypothetical protein
MDMKNKIILSFIILILFLQNILLSRNNSSTNSEYFAFPKIEQTNKPWSYWWWMGNAVDKKNLTKNLEIYQKAGMGGMHIVPIYGVKGYEEKYIDFLSPEWMEMLKHTVDEANRLGMGVDMSTGTGWPFGGPQVTTRDAAKKVILKNFSLKAGAKQKEIISDGELLCLMAFSQTGEIVELTEKVDSSGRLDWTAPDSTWEVFAVSQTGTGQQVKRAAPGGEGNVLNPFSISAMKNYLNYFENAFANYPGKMIRAFYNDSYEVYGADWTKSFFEEFESRRGYDFRQHLPALFDTGNLENIGRIKNDYRETIAELLLEEYTTPWVNWVQNKGSVARNEAHGSPGNLLDLYAVADIPETEIFGPSKFNIPGLRIDPDFPGHQSLPDPLMMKFASSAAHVAGKKLVASETCTWLGEHFKVALSQAKPEIDQLFVGGINHIFYHGITYSPIEESWPGWLFYASTNFGPSNSFWRDIEGLNNYIARCQSILQSGKPANDILLYFPIYDWWNKKEGKLDRFDVHSINKWLHPSKFYKSAKMLWERGFTFDYISDLLLQNVEFSNGNLKSGGSEYQTIVVPNCSYMPLKTLKKLMELLSQGATIIFHERFPYNVPGFFNFEARQIEFQDNITAIDLLGKKRQDIWEAEIGSGQVLSGNNLENLVSMAQINREPIVDEEIEFIRKRHDSGYHYFFANLSNKNLDNWVQLGTSAKSAVLFEPLTKKSGNAALRKTDQGETEVYLQLQPSESLILRTFFSQEVKGKEWKYLKPQDKTVPVIGPWQIKFLDNGTKLPSEIKTDTLASWTKIGDTKAKSFSGAANYSINFKKPNIDADDFILDLGKVCESARVKINGHSVGILWSLPFRIPVGKYLVKGNNKLEIEVTNLSANRIAELDRQGVYWKKFHNINFVNIKYKKFDASKWEPMDSGLLGPVQLIPVNWKQF